MTAGPAEFKVLRNYYNAAAKLETVSGNEYYPTIILVFPPNRQARFGGVNQQ
jgi:hypothetical protein